MIKIALSGKMQSGKTTVAEYLDRTYGAALVSIAAQLKINLLAADVNEDDLLYHKPPLVRELMQIYGQVMRDQDEDYWIKKALADAESWGDTFDLVVIDDLRFRNEAEKLRDDGWTLVRIERIGAQDVGTCGGDISEIDLDDWDDWDAVIKAGSGDLHALCSGVDAVVQKGM